jgi:PAS domain S-box-containing protein
MSVSTALRTDFDVESFIVEYYAAWGGTDEDRILSCYADNVTVQIPGCLMQGKSAVRDQFVRPFIAGFPGNRHYVKNIVCGRDATIVEFTFEAEHKGPFAGYVATNARIELPGCGVYEFDSQKRQITAARIYFDAGTLLKQITDQREPRLRTEEAVSPAGTIAPRAEWLDIATVIQISQALSGEVALEKLIDRLMRVAIKHAGADRGALICPRSDELLVYAEATAHGEDVAIQVEERDASGAGTLPESLVRYSLRTGETVVLDDASSQNSFSADPYIVQRRARSILCLPMINQGRFVGILYFENKLAPQIFTDRLTVLKVLATQGAISLENIGLYRALANREAKIRRLVDANILGICVWNLEGAIVEANEAFLHMLHYGREDVVSGRLRWTDLTPAELRERDERAVMELRSTGTFQPFEKEFFCKDGSRVPVLVGGALFEESSNEGVAFVLDLTKRKQLEEALRESEQSWRSAIDGIPGLVGILAPNGDIEAVNRPILEYYGKTLEELKSGWETCVHPEDLPRTIEVLTQSLASGEPFEAEFRARRFDGVYRWLQNRGLPLRDADGRVLRWYNLLIDIDERKRVEEALRESERKLRSAIDGIPGLVGVLAPNGDVEAVNRQILEYCGQSLEDLRNWGTNGTVHPDDLPHVADVFTKSIASGIPYQIEQRLRRFDGEYRWFDNRGIPVRDDSGRIIRWYVLLTDIDDRTRALTRLHQMQSDFARMNRVSIMGELAASLSHEITQPIASARNNARAALNYLERQPPELPEVREALGCVVDDADRAGEIVDRIRENVRKAPPRKDYFDLSAAISEVIALARSAIIKNGVLVQTRLTNGLSPVHGDRVQLQQVVMNLILNAVEAMGSVKVGARELLISTEQDHTGVLVAVCDSGPGIDPMHLERVFDAFYTTKSSGTGMGLSICQSIIDAHGGRLWAEMNEPRGAIFQFTLPGS